MRFSWSGLPFSSPGESSWPSWIWVSCTAGRLFTIWATRKRMLYSLIYLRSEQSTWDLRGLPKIRKLIKLITWTTALSNSMKLWAMLCRATQDRWVMVESSDKTCLENPMNSMKRQKGHWKMNSPGQAQYAAEEEWRIAPEKLKRLNQSENSAQSWMWQMTEVKSDAIKNNIA